MERCIHVTRIHCTRDTQKEVSGGGIKRLGRAQRLGPNRLRAPCRPPPPLPVGLQGVPDKEGSKEADGVLPGQELTYRPPGPRLETVSSGVMNPYLAP